MVQPTQTRISTDDYYELPTYAEHDLVQLIAGEVIISMPPIPKHQAIVREIIVLFTLFAREHGGQAFTSPIEVVLDKHNVFEPDVIYLAPDSRCTIGEKRLTGPPELVVEVLSPGTAKYDRQEKYIAYEKHRVSEYWIIDPLHETFEVWGLGKDGQFGRQGVYTRGDAFTSSTLQQDIEIRSIFGV